MFCNKCGTQMGDNETTCPSCGEAVNLQKQEDPTNPVPEPPSSPAVGSLNGPMPEELKGWSWAAFLMNWIWAIKHNVWIGLLALVPYAGFVMAIILGIKGNEWAWEKRRFQDVNQFKAVQKAWTKWGIILLIIGLALSIVISIIASVTQTVTRGVY